MDAPAVWVESCVQSNEFSLCCLLPWEAADYLAEAGPKPESLLEMKGRCLFLAIIRRRASATGLWVLFFCS